MNIFDRNTHIQNKMLALVSSVNLATKLAGDLDDPKSEISEFISAATFNFILKNLSVARRRQFTGLLQKHTDPKDMWAFVETHIADFEQKLAQNLQMRLEGIVKKQLQ